jgi:hypothetical protein
MIYSIYSNKSNTLFEQYPNMNAGQDEVLTIEKIISSSGTPVTYNSRAILDFDINFANLAALGAPTFSIGGGNVSKAFLNLYTTEAKALGATDTLKVSSIVEPWSQGLGRETNLPRTEIYSSWANADTAVSWSTAGGVTQSTLPPGGNPLVQLAYGETTDIQVDITNIITQISASVIEHYGFMISRQTTLETDIQHRGSLQYFSAETHTIYPPRLEFRWNDSTYAYAGQQLDMDNPDRVFFYLRNNKGAYKRGSKITFYPTGRLKYPAKTYGNTSAEVQIFDLQQNAWEYSIIDCKTEEVIMPFGVYTRVSNNANGPYFTIWSNSLFEERHYKIQLLHVKSTTYYDIKDTFKIVR